jgi:hypothetical protein
VRVPHRPPQTQLDGGALSRRRRPECESRDISRARARSSRARARTRRERGVGEGTPHPSNASEELGPGCQGDETCRTLASRRLSPLY